MSRQVDLPPIGPDIQVQVTDRLRLSDGALTIEIAPKHGGCITQFSMTENNRRINLFRQAEETAISGPLPLGAACFAMVPYAGRLRNGTFQHQSRKVYFPLAPFSEPHTSHGDGWQRPWQVSRRSQQYAVLTLSSVANPPLRYRCRQIISLNNAGLRLRIRIWNDEDVAIPIGIGLHPYFSRQGDPILTAKLPKRWSFDSELMPIELQENELALTLAAGAAVALLPGQGEFWGWDGKATINWPSAGISLNIHTRPPLRGAVLWAPPDKNFFCFEPISHSTDAFNFDKLTGFNHGVVILEPGAQYKQDIFFDLDCAVVGSTHT